MENLLTLQEVARILKVPPSTIYKLVREHKLPAHKVGKHWRFCPLELSQWIKGSALG